MFKSCTATHLNMTTKITLTLNLQELIDKLNIHIVQYDRAGYGESDPYPKRSLESEALDIEELADQLQIGSKFYVIGVSMGSYAAWSCLHYIPNRQISSLKICITMFSHMNIVGNFFTIKVS